MCKETGDCVAVKIVTVDGKEGLSHECLRKEVCTAPSFCPKRCLAIILRYSSTSFSFFSVVAAVGVYSEDAETY